LRFFLDNNLAPKLARGFHQFVLGEHEVVHLRDRFDEGTPDADWMRELASESGWSHHLLSASWLDKHRVLAAGAKASAVFP